MFRSTAIFLLKISMVMILAIYSASCCKECETCPEQNLPQTELIGSWECYYATLDGDPFASAIGIQLAFEPDGTLSSPLFPETGDPWTYVANEEKVFLDDGEFATAMYYSVTNSDTLRLWTEPSGLIPTIVIDYRFFRI